MSIRTKLIVNTLVFLTLAILLTVQELRTFHPNLFGV